MLSLPLRVSSRFSAELAVRTSCAWRPNPNARFVLFAFAAPLAAAPPAAEPEAEHGGAALVRPCAPVLARGSPRGRSSGLVRAGSAARAAPAQLCARHWPCDRSARATPRGRCRDTCRSRMALRSTRRAGRRYPAHARRAGTRALRDLGQRVRHPGSRPRKLIVVISKGASPHGLIATRCSLERNTTRAIATLLVWRIASRSRL